MTSPMDERTAVAVMPEAAAAELLARFGIEYPAHRFAATQAEAVAAADELGYPVVLKVVADGISHKSDVGGVVTGISDVAGVRSAAERIDAAVAAARPDVALAGYLVCRHVGGGHEVIVGGVRDATFGPTVMFGLGGIFAEVLRDVAFRVAPLTAEDAQDMLGEIRGAAVLRGARTGEAADRESLVRALLGVSRLLMERPDIMELDLNPMRALAGGAVALDARVVVSCVAAG